MSKQEQYMSDYRQKVNPRRDRLKQLRAFCQAARFGSVSRAAERVMASQPAVSTQIRMLEEEIGVQLFERRGPRISLSRIGRRFYRRAMPLVEGMDRLPDTFLEEQRGDTASNDLVVGAGHVSAAYVLPRFLKRFAEEHPQIKISVKLGAGRQRLDWLRNHELDLVVAAMDVTPPDLAFLPIFDSEFVLIVPADHPLAGRDSVDFEEASAYPFIWHTAGHYIRQAAEVIMRLHGAAPETAVEVDGWGVIAQHVAAGVGVAVVPDVCAAVVPAVRTTGRHPVWTIRFPGMLPPRRYGAITRRDGLVSLSARRFMDLLAAGKRELSGAR